MQALHAWSHSVKRYTVILAFWWNAYGTGRPFTFLKQSGAMSLLITNSRNFNNPFYKCSKENSWALLIFFRGIYCPSDSITCSTSSAKTVPFQINRHQICLTVWEVIVFSLRERALTEARCMCSIYRMWCWMGVQCRQCSFARGFWADVTTVQYRQ